MNMRMQKTRSELQQQRSKLQQQLQLVNDIFKPFLTLTTTEAIEEQHRLVCRTVFPEFDGEVYFEFWSRLYDIWDEQVAKVIMGKYSQYHDRSKAAEYHKKLVELSNWIHEDIRNMAENEMETSHDNDNISATLYDHAAATRLAKRFLHLILLLYAVPQPEELSAFEKGDADFGWRLGLCKTYQDNTAFMVVVRDLSVLLLFVAEGHEDTYSEHSLQVPPEVLSVCQQYAKVARDNLAAARAAVKADVFQRGVLHAIRKNEHTLKEDEVGLITDKTRHKANTAAMFSLLCRLHNLR